MAKGDKYHALIDALGHPVRRRVLRRYLESSARLSPKEPAVAGATLLGGDCREVLETLDPESIDAVVTDPPYAIGQLVGELETLAANPDLVRFSLIAPPAADGQFAECYRKFLERLVELIGKGHPSTRDGDLSDGAALATAGGLSALLVAKVKAGEGEQLPELLPDLVELLLTPYLGRERAAAEART
jgi:hypothetical protein